MRRLLALVLVLALPVSLAACGDDGEDGGADPPSTTATTEPAPAAGGGNEGCETAEPETKDVQLDAPKDRLPAGKTHRVTLETTCGEIVIELDVKENPKTASSFAYLVEEGFYDGLTFHRIASQNPKDDFVIQGGDPLGEGTGGPGYSVVEEPPADQPYTRGVVAMAKTGAEAPGTSGSQFYIVTAEDSGLPPEYAVVGEIVEGDDVVTKISQVEADPATEAPLEPVVITKATLSSE